MPAGYAGTIDTSVAGQVRLIVESTQPPSFGNPSIDGSNLDLNGAGGPANAAYEIVGSQDITLPMTDWSMVASGQLDGDGSFSLSIPIDPNALFRFYAIKLVE